MREYLYEFVTTETPQLQGAGRCKPDHGPDQPASTDCIALVDRHGNRHSAAVLTSWSPAAIKALGIRPATNVEAGHA